MYFKASQILTISICAALSSATLLFDRPSWANVTVPVENILSSLGQVEVPVLLPNQLPFLKEHPVYFNSTANSSGYEVSFEYAQNCNLATACFIGSITAERNNDQGSEEAQTSKVVRLADGTQGQFTNFCGAYCMANLRWQSQGVLYKVTMKNGQLEDLVQIASSAAQAGPRTQSGVSPETARRIKFEPGATKAQVQSSLTNKQPNIYYVVKARAGQHMTVSAVPQTPPKGLATLVTVTSPSGKSSADKSAKFDAKLTESGDYVVRVFRNLMASSRDTGPFVLEVVIR